MKDPDKEFEKLIEKEKPHHLVYFKVLFLLIIIFLGMGIFRLFSDKNTLNAQEVTTEYKSQTLESLFNIPSKFSNIPFLSSFQNEVENNPVSKNLLSLKKQVLGVASDEAKLEHNLFSELINKLYDNTILNFLQQIISNLPQNQQDRLLEKIEN